MKNIIISVFLLGMLFLTSCYWDKEEVLYPQLSSLTSGCDTSNVTYSKTIAPIFASNCNSCHSGSGASGGLDFSNYSVINTNIDKIISAITPNGSGAVVMPQSGISIGNCSINKINIWKKKGTLNN